MLRLWIFLSAALALSLATAQDEDLRPIDFNRDIRPIISDRCFHCHGPDAENQRSDYRLDTEENSRVSFGDDLFGIRPGNLKQSEVHWRIRADDEGDLMPPPDSNRVLSEEEKDLLDRWISEGAEYDGHWSFKPIPKSVPVPERGEADLGEIDAFIEDGILRAGLQRAAPSSAEKWLRRVTFDLTGLPPTLEEIDAFLADKTEGAEGRVVDRLLATTAHAERLTSEWLDVARYSDTYGFQVDRDRSVWPWRDWVIDAFQRNLPFDQFIVEQVAGDLLPDASRDQILATTFNRLHPQKVEGGSVPEEFRTEYVSDRLHTFGTAFLGLTMECARCHDHKYDPVSTREYYQLSSYFANIDEAGLYSYFTKSVPTPTLNLPTEAQEKQLADAETAVEQAEKKLIGIEKAADEAFDAWKTDPPQAPGRRNLLSHLDFEKVEGGKIPDAVQPDKPATTNGANQPVPGKTGQGLSLTGDHAVKLTVGNFTRDQPFSIALWLRAAEITERQLVFRRSKAWTDAASRGLELLLLDGRLSLGLVHFEPGNSLRVDSQQTLSAGTWHHVAVTYDGSSRAAGVRLFLDGNPLEGKVIYDQLTREIVGGGDDFLAIGERMRDKGFKGGAVDEFHVFDRRLAPIEVAELHTPGTWAKAEEADRRAYFLASEHAPLNEARAELRKAREARSKVVKATPEIMVMRESKKTRQAYILNRGSYEQRGEPVDAGVPAILSDFPGGEANNRLGLARWLIADEQPLTARVTVNRYWQMFFGYGLMRTPEDFGLQGEFPTHPELLDWLARDFMDHDWDLRRLLRQIVLTDTYRQSSVVSPEVRDQDPENRLFARGPGDRLPAEMIRDNALHVAGLLDDRVGGASDRPYDLEVSFKPTAPGNVYRRSLYTYWRRTGPSPVMMALDASKRDVCRVRREATASPIQALVLLNGPQFVEASRVLAARLVETHGDDDTALVEDAFRLLSGRLPSEKEATLLAELLAEQRDGFQATPAEAKTYLEVGKAPQPKEDQLVEVAAVAVLVNTLLNFDESVSRR